MSHHDLLVRALLDDRMREADAARLRRAARQRNRARRGLRGLRGQRDGLLWRPRHA